MIEVDSDKSVSGYSPLFCDELREHVENKIVIYQCKLKEIQLWEELNKFGDLGLFETEFMETEFSIWLNYATDSDKNSYIEERLKALPFEQAYCYKNPEFYTKSRMDILREVFNDASLDWRENPELARNMSLQEKYRIIKRFEYMCYYVINRRDELLYDICDFLKN